VVDILDQGGVLEVGSLGSDEARWLRSPNVNKER